MNFKDYAFGIIGICVIGVFMFIIPDRQEKYQATVFWHDQIFRVDILNREWADDVCTLSEQNALYFDGQSFFEVPPTDKEYSRCSLINMEDHSYGIKGGIVGRLFCVIIALLVLFLIYGIFSSDP